MNNNFEMILDFLLNFKTNKSSIEKISSEVKKILETIQPELNLNDADAIDTIKELVKYMYEAEDAGEALGAALKGMEIDINDEAVINS